MRKVVIQSVVVCLMSIVSVAAMAGPAADALTACLADNTTGKERKALAKWVFSAIAAHPDMQDLSKSTEASRDQIDRVVGAMVTKLLTETCVAQTRTAMVQEGSKSLESAFSSLGELAMQELMSNQGVTQALSGFEKYLDKKKFETSFTPE